MTAIEYEHKIGVLMNTVKVWMNSVTDVKLNELEAYVKNGNELHKMFDNLLFSKSPDERTEFPESTQKLIRAAIDLYFEGFTNVLFPLRRALKEYNKAVMISKLFKLSKWYIATEHK